MEKETAVPDIFLAKMIESIKDEKIKSVEYMSIQYEKRNDGFYLDGKIIYTKEEIRNQWARLNLMQRLIAQAEPIAMTPTSDLIILRPLESEAFLKSKLLVPGTLKGEGESLGKVYSEMPLQGIVVAVGPGFMTDSGIYRPVGCNIGDHVILKVGSALLSDFIYKGLIYYQTRSADLVTVTNVEYREYISEKYSLRFAKI